jgi:hypothetical protein
MKNFVCVLLLGLTILSCTKKHEEPSLKYTDEEFTHLIGESGAAVDKSGPAINFSDYVPGVNKVSAKSLSYEHLQFYALEFESVEQARAEALRLNQYYSRNWLFDRVEGEPMLEDLVIIKFKAINPKRVVQRKPIHVPHKAEGAHGAGAESGEGGGGH